jgi:hypothetical protein
VLGGINVPLRTLQLAMERPAETLGLLAHGAVQAETRHSAVDGNW